MSYERCVVYSTCFASLSVEELQMFDDWYNINMDLVILEADLGTSCFALYQGNCLWCVSPTPSCDEKISADSEVHEPQGLLSQFVGVALGVKSFKGSIHPTKPARTLKACYLWPCHRPASWRSQFAMMVGSSCTGKGRY